MCESWLLTQRLNPQRSDTHVLGWRCWDLVQTPVSSCRMWRSNDSIFSWLVKETVSCPTCPPLTRSESNTKHKSFVPVLIKQTGFFLPLSVAAWLCKLTDEVPNYQIKPNLDLVIQVVVDLVTEWSVRNPCSSFWARAWLLSLKRLVFNTLWVKGEYLVCLWLDKMAAWENAYTAASFFIPQL